MIRLIPRAVGSEELALAVKLDTAAGTLNDLNDLRPDLEVSLCMQVIF